MKNKDFWEKVKSKLSTTSKILDLGTNAVIFKEYKNFSSLKNSPLKNYECVIATDYFEYDPFYEVSMMSLFHSLPSNGVFVFTISFTPINDDIDYYKHLTEKDIKSFFSMDLFKEHYFEIDNCNDLLFYGIKK